MGDVTTPALHCSGCDGEYFRKSANGPIPKRCPACAQTRQREQTRQGDMRRWAAQAPVIDMTFTCQDCSGRFERFNRSGPAPKRCDACIAEEARAHSRRCNERTKNRLAAAFLEVGRASSCADCGAQFGCARMGPKTKRCRPCRLLRRSLKEHTPVPPLRPIKCLGCPKMLRRVRYGHGLKRCSDCRSAFAKERSQELRLLNLDVRRAYERAHRHLRIARKRANGYEVFRDIEIFERDRWRCGICEKRINKRLRYPHPMSASLDHVVPVSQGGPHLRSNVRASHLRCNVSRGNRGGNEQLALVG